VGDRLDNHVSLMKRPGLLCWLIGLWLRLHIYFKRQTVREFY